MKRLFTSIRRPVKRRGAEHYLLVMLLSFAASVTLTRLFLYLTGYPQIGGGGLHLAHVLWGGLLLFIAAILPVIFANRWVYELGSVLSGVGVGLFIDEVGKFVTQSNDYFYPGAAPIIYAFFLLSVMIYMQVRRPLPRDPRAELYRALEMLEDVIDHDLDEDECALLEDRLTFVAEQASHPDLARLAERLLFFIRKEGVALAPVPPSYIRNLLAWANNLEERYISRLRARAVLVGGMVALSMASLSSLGQVYMVRFQPAPIERLLGELMAEGIVTGTGSLRFFLARALLEGLVGLLLFAAAILLSIGHDRRGISYGYVALLLSLTVVDLLVFYFDQFSTIAMAIFQFTTLLGVLYYRERFLPNEET